MSLSLIVAMTEERIIGNNNQLPWHISEDLKRFKKITTGHPIIMGRKTYESIGKPLPGRQNIVVTHNQHYQADGVLVVHSLEEALDQCDKSTGEEFVIGGAALFESALPKVKKLYLTIVHQFFKGDVYFPEFDENDFEFGESVTHPPPETGGTSYSFVEGIRRADV